MRLAGFVTGLKIRKAARRRAEGNDAPITVTPEVVVEMLGAPRFLDEEMEERTKDPGVAIGLAWTPAGGEVLFIEASRMAGTGALTLTTRPVVADRLAAHPGWTHMLQARTGRPVAVAADCAIKGPGHAQ